MDNYIVDKFIFICSLTIFKNMKTYKDILTPTLEETGEGKVRVIFYMGEVEMVCLYYEKAKKGWTNKPIMPQAWRCVDSKVSNPTIYEQGLIEPKELVGWGQDLIKQAGMN